MSSPYFFGVGLTRRQHRLLQLAPHQDDQFGLTPFFLFHQAVPQPYERTKDNPCKSGILRRLADGGWGFGNFFAPGRFSRYNVWTDAMRMEPENQIKPHLVAHIIMLVVFLSLVAYISFKFGPAITRLMSRPERFKEFIDAYGSTSVLLYILIQAAHVIIVVIPGEIVQIAGGYAFGTFYGTFYSLIGIIVGTLIVFFATRLAGYSLVRTFVSPEKLKRFDFLINSPKSEIALFVLFLIPGLPKDTLVYISGLTPIKPWRFLLICTIARFPGLWGSAYIGANLQEKDYVPVWIMSGLALVLFVVGILIKDKIIGRLHRHWRSGKNTPPGN